MLANQKTIPSLLLTRRQVAKGVAPSPCSANADILVLVDDDALLSVLHDAVEALPVTLSLATSTTEALEWAAQRDFALMVLQGHLAGQDAAVLAELIRGHSRAQQTPIVFLTSTEHGLPQVFPGQEFGLVDYLAQPLVPQAVTAKLQVFLRLYQQSVQLTREIEERRGIDEQLKAAERQLRGLATRLLTIKDEEQVRIAREIHDSLGQALAALKLDLLWIAKRLPNDQAMQDKANAMAGLIEETILSLREIVTRLRPDILEQMGLVPALAHLTRDFESHTGIECDFHGDLSRGEPDWERGTALLRICQELLTNVARHAEASRVQVQIRGENDSVILEVHDNGKGMSPAERRKPASLGLVGMRERVAPFDGQMQIDSGPGGTRVRVSIPLDLSAQCVDAASA